MREEERERENRAADATYLGQQASKYQGLRSYLVPTPVCTRDGGFKELS